jgi:hypothetical protein
MKNDRDLTPLAGPIVGYVATAIALAILLMA